MKNTLWIQAVILLFAGVHMLARQTPAPSPAAPCNEQATADKKKEAIDFDPLLDPAEELRMRAQKKMEEQNFKELQAAATELATVSAKMSKEIDASGQYVISLRVQDDLDQIEKLTKKVRSRAK
jgi:hypothetical protein